MRQEVSDRTAHGDGGSVAVVDGAEFIKLSALPHGSFQRRDCHRRRVRIGRDVPVGRGQNTAAKVVLELLQDACVVPRRHVNMNMSVCTPEIAILGFEKGLETALWDGCADIDRKYVRKSFLEITEVH